MSLRLNKKRKKKVVLCDFCEAEMTAGRSCSCSEHSCSDSFTTHQSMGRMIVGSASCRSPFGDVEWTEKFRMSHDVPAPRVALNANTLDGLHLRLAGSARPGSDHPALRNDARPQQPVGTLALAPHKTVTLQQKYSRACGDIIQSNHIPGF